MTWHAAWIPVEYFMFHFWAGIGKQKFSASEWTKLLLVQIFEKTHSSLTSMRDSCTVSCQQPAYKCPSMLLPPLHPALHLWMMTQTTPALQISLPCDLAARNGLGVVLLDWHVQYASAVAYVWSMVWKATSWLNLTRNSNEYASSFYALLYKMFRYQNTVYFSLKYCFSLWVTWLFFCISWSYKVGFHEALRSFISASNLD